MHDKILILDFGSQVTQLIARRVREEKVYSEIVPFQKAEAAFREMNPKAVILSGGPASVHEKDAPLAPMSIYQAGVPVLGICYGEQAMAHQLGGALGLGLLVLVFASAAPADALDRNHMQQARELSFARERGRFAGGQGLAVDLDDAALGHLDHLPARSRRLEDDEPDREDHRRGDHRQLRPPARTETCAFPEQPTAPLDCGTWTRAQRRSRGCR